MLIYHPASVSLRGVVTIELKDTLDLSRIFIYREVTRVT